MLSRSATVREDQVGNKILLIDDSVTVQKIITLTFSDEGVDVVTVDSGDEAINLLHYLRPALVMADVSIPGKNGYDVCAYIKNNPELKNIPVVLLVPGFETYDAERARRVGADHHLTKPFQSIRSLITTVKSLIDPRGGAASLPGVSQTQSGLSAASLVLDESLLETDSALATDTLSRPSVDSPLTTPDAPVIHIAPELVAAPASVPGLPPDHGAMAAMTDLEFQVDAVVERVTAGVGERVAAEIAAMRREIVERVCAELVERLAEQLAVRLGDELKPLLTQTAQPAPLTAVQVAPPTGAGRPGVGAYDDPDQLLELDEF